MEPIAPTPDSTDLRALASEATRLRRAGRLNEALQLVAARTATLDDPAAASLRHAYSKLWWAPVEGRRCRLRRRSPEDRDFIRRCWADHEFMSRFNRFAARLPDTDGELEGILQREYVALPLADGGLHWTVETFDGRPFGMLSLVSISRSQRRAEILVGIRDAPYAGCAGEAMYRAMEFALADAGIEKLEGTIYRDNTAALNNYLHLGFAHEGVRRQHLRDPRSGQRHDVVLAGFVAADFANATTNRLFRRLLGRPPKL